MSRVRRRRILPAGPNIHIMDLEMMSTREQLLREIEAFLADTGMSAGRFGQSTVGDRAFVGTLRRGRDPMLRTVDRIRAFIAAERGKKRRPKKKSRAEPVLAA